MVRGSTLDDVLRAENERLTEERNSLQQQIRQLEQMLGSSQELAAEEPTATDAVCDADKKAKLGYIIVRSKA